jgi:hypothetical protein
MSPHEIVGGLTTRDCARRSHAVTSSTGASFQAGEATAPAAEDHGCMEEPHRGNSSERTVPAAVDAALGAAALATSAAVSLTRLLARAAAPVRRLVMHPPVLDERLHPARVVEALAGRGHLARTSAGADLNRIIAAVVPPAIDVVQTIKRCLDRRLCASASISTRWSRP